MNDPKISVILVYNNSENTIKECIDSINSQSFSDLEIICVNNACKDNSEEIAKEAASHNKKIKLISLPVVNELFYARKAGLDIASGDFICFIEPKDILPPDFIKDLYLKLISNEEINLKTNHLYRRVFLENNDDIVLIINEKILNEMNNKSFIIDEKLNDFRTEFDKFYQHNIEIIKNNTYELNCRFNQLEKLFYTKDLENKNRVENIAKTIDEKVQQNNKYLYDDITKVYDYINSEINKKGCEINQIYEDITKNYHYTEKLVNDKNKEYLEQMEKEKDNLYKKLSELEKEIIVRYVNLKRLLDMSVDEIDLKFKASNINEVNNLLPASIDMVNIEKNITENIDKIYSHINKTNSVFYEELAKIYKEINEKQNKKYEDEKYTFENKLQEVKNELSKEFDIKLQKLKDELSK